MLQIHNFYLKYYVIKQAISDGTEKVDFDVEI